MIDEETKLTEKERRWIEIIAVGVVFGIATAWIGAWLFLQVCPCYEEDEIGITHTVYMTRRFDIPKLNCEDQCKFFGEREGINMTNKTPERIERERWNLSKIEINI
jgi:hypothetical protein